ncbi:hypothetical protein CYJ80_10915 [Lactobacillus crispatus]|nr:hypothetical protein CYJ80_10915 [Lactobacillus crispatus]
MFFVQINHTGKGFLFLIFREIKLRKYSSLHKLFYGLNIRFNKHFSKILNIFLILIRNIIYKCWKLIIRISTYFIIIKQLKTIILHSI